MAFEENEVLLLGISHSNLGQGLWYLDTRATSHMTGERSLSGGEMQSYCYKHGKIHVQSQPQRFKDLTQLYAKT
ncbi:unnamed protein product [Spirodela intermedia]|uniref:Uncharacterized protein n=1 Tax=Spirodela intermedia TaxID=51605 RepID=A0A7I8JFR2_SPIIN|nr:unnamed protein product [Spirodela intermedia]CAA6668242.1 unnamed protein product [Spirodela intermedia]